MAGRGDEGRFEGAGGLSIAWRAWLPVGDPRAVVLIAHGAGEHGGRYEWVGGELAARGHAAYAIDHRGHGRSDGPRALVDSIDDAVEDLHRLAGLAAGRHPGAPTFLLGHSMGGAIAIAYAARHQGELTGLVLSAPFAAVDAGPVVLAGVRVLSRVAPRLPVRRIDATTVSRDPEVVAAYDADPLNHHGPLPARTVGELVRSVELLGERLPALRLPLLTMYGSGDRLVPPAGSELVDARAGSDDATLTAYDGLYHELLNEPERERVLSDVADWLEARLSWGPADAAGGAG